MIVAVLIRPETLTVDGVEYGIGMDLPLNKGQAQQHIKMMRARGVCQTGSGKVLNITYKVAQLGQRMVMMVMELRSAGTPAVPNTAGPANVPPNAAKDNGIVVPGPNEL